MRKPRFRQTYPALVIIAGFLALASAFGPIASETGAPAFGGVIAEQNCRLCHSGNALNTGGSITITGLPVGGYKPDSVYRLTITLASTQTAANPGRNWGFQLTAARKDNGQGVGTFTVVSPQTRIISGIGSFASRRYVEHTCSPIPSCGPREAEASPVSWEVDWTAPSLAQDANDVYFCAAGNAANGTGSTAFDWIYTRIDSLGEDTTPTAAESWGSLKARYRK